MRGQKRRQLEAERLAGARRHDTDRVTTIEEHAHELELLVTDVLDAEDLERCPTQLDLRVLTLDQAQLLQQFAR